jgi:hypothetical protein
MKNKSENICYPYETSTIFHFIVPIWDNINIEPTLHKFSFVGVQEKESKLLLAKLEKGQTLNTEEVSELNKFIPNWKNIIGDIKNYSLHFIYQYIEDNTPIFHIISILYEIIPQYIKSIDISLNSILIYKKNKNMSYETLINYLNFIFGDELTLSSDEFYKKIYEMSYLTKEEVEKEIRKLLASKYKDEKVEISFINQNIYNYVDCIHSEELFHFLLNIPIILTHNYTTETGNYYGSVILPSLVINGGEKLNKKLSILPSNITSNKDGDHLFQNLSYYSKTINNEYFVLLKKMMKLFIKDESYIKYFYDEFKHIPNINTISLFNNSLIRVQKNYLEIQNCSTKNMIIEFNSQNTSAKINLAKIFQNYPTSFYTPVIKYFSNGNPYKYKFFQQFLISKLDNTLIKKIIGHSGSNTGNFIQFKWIIEDKNIFTIEIFDNLLIRLYIEEDNYQSLNHITPFLDVLNATIKKIKQIVNISYLTIPAINTVFQEISPVLYNYSLISGNLKISGNLDNPNKYKPETYIHKFSTIIKKYPQFIYYDLLGGDTIKLFYKQVGQFYNNDSINQFIANRVNKKGIRLNFKQDREKLIKYIVKIFLLNEDAATNFVNKWTNSSTDLSSTLNVDFIYGIDVGFKIFKDNKFEFEIIDNLDSFATIKKILYYFECILHEIHISPSVLQEKIESKPLLSQKYKIDTETSKTKVNKSISQSNDLGLDFSLDLGLDLDLGIDMGDTEITTDSNKSKVSKNVSLDKYNEVDKYETSIDDDEFKGLKLQKIISGDKKLRFNNYINELNKIFDPELVNIIGNNKSCEVTQFRLPYPVSKQQLETFDPSAFNGYIKYRNTYYICPRLWDYKANKPVSINSFIAAGLKSPYSGGKLVNMETKVLDDIHTVLLRKARSGAYWEDSKKEKELPDIFKRTGREAYPGLIPKDKFCIPCCFSKMPSDFDPNKKEIQQLFKFKGAEDCKDDKQQEKKIIEDTNICINSIEFYILGDNAILPKCRFGQLPKNLDLLLNNHQEYFVSKSGTFNDNSNVFLRRGVLPDEKNNFLETIATVSNMTLQSLKNKIVNKLDLKLFLSLNNGELIDIYSNSNILPSTIIDFERFKEFTERERVFFNLLDIDYSVLNKITFENILNPEDTVDIRKLILVYKIYKSYYNFIRHLLDPDEYKNYTHYIDLVSRPLDWLFPTGVNIMIFDKSGSNIQCNPYIKTYNKNFMILIRENDFSFIPVYHIIMQEKKLIPNAIKAIINVDNIDISSKVFFYYKDKLNVKKEILKLMQRREESFLKMILMHQDNCNSSINYESKNMITELSKYNFNVEYSILATTTQFEYIILNNMVMLPVFPCSIELEYGHIKLLTEIELPELDFYLELFSLNSIVGNLMDDINTEFKLSFEARKSLSSEFIKKKNSLTVLLDKTSKKKTKTKSKSQSNFKKDKKNKEDKEDKEEEEIEGDISKLGFILSDYNYIIKNILIHEKDDTIVAIRFYNNLVLPVKPEKITIAKKRKILEILEYNNEMIDNLFIDTELPFAYKQEEFKKLIKSFLPSFWETTLISFPSISTKNNILDIKKLLISDYSYNHFKYEFSKIIQESTNKKYKKLIIKFLTNMNQKLVNNEINIYEITDILSIVMKNYVNINDDLPSITRLTSDNNLKLCYKTTKKCYDSPFCSPEIKMKNINLLDNNKSKKSKTEYKINNCKIQISSSYYEYFIYLLTNDLVNNTIERNEILDASFIPQKITRDYLLTNEKDIIVNSEEITALLEKGLFSKYKKNINLSNFLFKGDNIYTLSPKEIEQIDEERTQQLRNLYSQVIIDLTNANLRNIIPKDVIIATPFDKDGRLDPRYSYGECIFPFFGRNRKLNHHCVDSMLGYRCPIKVDSKRIPINWGFCPENKDATKTRTEYIPVTAVSADDKKFSNGSCQFPYLAEEEEENSQTDKSNKIDDDNKQYKLKYTCIENKEGGQENWYSWCPTKLGYNPLEYPLYPAAEKLENILIGKYRKAKLYSSKTTMKNLTGKTIHKFTINPIYLETRKKGYCRLPSKLIDKPKIKEGIREIKLEDYNVQKAHLSESKDGYKREELYYFGVNVLKIPQTQLLKGKTMLEKDDLIRIINKKVREIRTKTVITDEDRLLSYEKDIDKCNEGESRGGYGKLELREIAINYFDLDEEIAKTYGKQELCDYVIPKIQKIKQEDIDIISSSDKKDIGKGYPGDIKKCIMSTKKGGIGKKKLEKIATNNFKLNITGLHKQEICKLIEEKLKQIKEGISTDVLIEEEQIEDNIEKILKKEEDEKISLSINLEDLKKILEEE